MVVHSVESAFSNQAVANEEDLNSAALRYPDYDKDALAWFRKSMEYNCVGGS